VLSTVLSIRISKDVKRRMDELRDVVDWNYEIKRFLEARVDELYRRKIIEEVRRVVELLPEMPRGSVTKYVREDRDSH
jgi:hypothetical protein